jgi:CHAD domain-containing protein
MADGKWIEGLTPDMDLATAAKRVLHARFEVVRHFLPLAAEQPYEDLEYVHQLRVGTRRAGAALRVFADCLPRKHLRSARRSLRLIRRAAADARDWDVFLLGIASARPLSAASGLPARDFLTGYAMGERSASQNRLVEAANSGGPTFMVESAELPELVHAPRGESAPATFGDLAASHLGQLLAAFTAAAEANPTKPAELHQLRILGKRVRYALEIFVECFPPIFKEKAYAAVEEVQGLLGDVQDASVGLNRLAGLRTRLKANTPDTWPRLQKGFEGLMHSLRSKIPAGRKGFQKWRVKWSELVTTLTLDAVISAATA